LIKSDSKDIYNVSILNHCCSFELSIHQGILKISYFKRRSCKISWNYGKPKLTRWKLWHKQLYFWQRRNWHKRWKYDIKVRFM